MAGEHNLEKTKQAYAAFAAGDVAAASENLADDIEWIVPGNSKVSGTYRGKDDVIGFWMNLAEKSFTTAPEHFLADEERVVVLTSTTADGHSSDSVDVLTFRDGKVVKFQTASDTALQEHVWGTK
jgi:ketosteroid isomerase-like protein